MQSMIASQHQLIRRSNAQINNNGNQCLDASPPKTPSKTSHSSESLQSLDQSSTEKDIELSVLTNGKQSVESSIEANQSSNDSNNSPSDPKRCQMKKKRATNSWLNILNPTYKTRHEEFKKLFSNLVPNNERLVVDYSCALQKDILVHGRLYLSLNYISFYANIFKWETSLVIKCCDITSLTKANTARVIPNAIQVVTTSGDKYVFTSFAARDKSYVMLFRIWQNALLAQPMSSAQLWQWVHYSYGEDLGLTSEDEEEYYSDKSVHVLSSESNPMSISGSEINSSDHDLVAEREVFEETSDSKSNVIHECQCPDHEGKVIIDLTFPVFIDRLFELIFTDSKFLHTLHKSRRTYDLSVTQWEDADKDKTRQLTYTVALNHALVKSARTIERQRMLADSCAGKYYTIKSEAENEGVPYCDTFSMHSVWCLSQEAELTRIRVHARVVFKKSSWSLSLVKPMIEKSSIQGITDFCNDLSRQLPNWLQMERSLGVVPSVADELEVGTDSGSHLANASSDSSLSELDVTKASPLSNHSRHGIVRRLFAKFSSLSDPLMVKIIFLLLLFSLVLNVLIMTRIWEIESKVYDSSAADQTISELSSSNFRLFIEKTIETVKKIESNLIELKNRIKDEL